MKRRDRKTILKEEIEKQIRELPAKRERVRRYIEKQGKREGRRLAEKRGEVVRFVKDLKCPKHPEGKFIRSRDPIPGSHMFFTSDKDGFKFRQGFVYFCRKCLKEEVDPDKITRAYECPFCRLVMGKYTEELTYIAGGLLEPHKPSRRVGGYNYFCRICGTQIGQREEVLSKTI